MTLIVKFKLITVFTLLLNYDLCFCFRPYIVNLLPCLARICKREDEGIQETILLAMNKICPALMVFANDTEVKVQK